MLILRKCSTMTRSSKVLKAHSSTSWPSHQKFISKVRSTFLCGPLFMVFKMAMRRWVLMSSIIWLKSMENSQTKHNGTHFNYSVSDMWHWVQRIPNLGIHRLTTCRTSIKFIFSLWPYVNLPAFALILFCFILLFHFILINW